MLLVCASPTTLSALEAKDWALVLLFTPYKGIYKSFCIFKPDFVSNIGICGQKVSILFSLMKGERCKNLNGMQRRAIWTLCWNYQRAGLRSLPGVKVTVKTVWSLTFHNIIGSCATLHNTLGDGLQKKIQVNSNLNSTQAREKTRIRLILNSEKFILSELLNRIQSYICLTQFKLHVKT